DLEALGVLRPLAVGRCDREPRLWICGLWVFDGLDLGWADGRAALVRGDRAPAKQPEAQRHAGREGHRDQQRPAKGRARRLYGRGREDPGLEPLRKRDLGEAPVELGQIAR